RSAVARTLRRLRGFVPAPHQRGSPPARHRRAQAGDEPMNATPDRFVPAARALHWLMAVMIVAMLFIGVGMVATVSARHEWLLAIHKPLGMAILLLAVIRLAVRLRHPPPP